jgi:hypothetical protein
LKWQTFRRQFSCFWPIATVKNSRNCSSFNRFTNDMSSWSYWCWIYNYLCNQCLSPLKLQVRTLFMVGVLDTTLCDKVCQWLAISWWFSPGTPVSSTNKTHRHDIAEILLKAALNTIHVVQSIVVHSYIGYSPCNVETNTSNNNMLYFE